MAGKLMELKKLSYSNEDDDDILFPGFRFRPTDEELVGFYLKRKVEMKAIKIDLIKNIDVYKYEPWDLPKQASSAAGDKEREWYFFCRRGRKYKNSIRPNRVTGCGFWKATGIDKPIYSAREFQDCIGLKKSLVYYRGSAGKGTKTEWMMHEFRLPAPKTPSNVANNRDLQEAEVWTLCRIFKREASYRKYPSSSWQKFASKQTFKDSGTKMSFSESSDDGFKYKSFEVSTYKMMKMKPDANNYLYENNQLLAGQLSLATQVPLMASHVNFCDQSGDEAISFEDGTWDELRPMVDYAFCHP
ncbi:hypothetical protein P3X46_020083 [Hevea brasiliensis]|uniref:NAC domain-containing protein n=1 Tax=Hevea brasiliensis TaxID=3981 RepID=A0ABQ9LNW6_HEVBR|nr:transcription factor JUNGBRUNNEN 1 [Hevea brasiliensis]KAJ9168580.1 hypothetical protein P3X46_020083 [Hevea brasiliensis]